MGHTFRHFLITALLAAASAAAEPDDEGFVPLFNGNDLTGWVLTNTPPATWTFQDGMLICSGKPVGEIRTERMYQNFIMELSGWTGEAEARGAWHANDWVLSCDGPKDGKDAALVTTEQFGNVGFVFDAKFKGGSKSLQVRLRNAAIDTSNPVIGKHLESPGRWNRFEGTLSGNLLTLTVNGHEAFQDQAIDKLADHGPISISPGGPIDLANIYVRELSSSSK